MDEMQLKGYAKAYLSSGDAQAENGLLRAGTKIIPLLLQVFAEMLQDWGSKPVKPMFEQLVKSLAGSQLLDSGSLSYLNQQIGAMSNEPGVSLVTQSLAEEAISRAWQLVTKFRDEGTSALIAQIQNRDPVIRCAAALILTGAEPLSYASVKHLEGMWSFFDTLDMSRHADEVLFVLYLTVLAKSGHQEFLKMVDEYCQQARWSREEFYRNSVHDGMNVVTRKGRG